MDRKHATAAQRVGIALALVEAAIFGFLAALHLGLVVQVAGRTFAAGFLYPAAIVEALLALALLLAVALPGGSNVRAGRVMGAQIFVIIGIFVLQVALLRGGPLLDLRSELVYACTLVLALASIALIAASAPRRRVHAR
jgi:hypothetical protein